MNCRKLDFELDFIEVEDEYGKIEQLFVTALYEVGKNLYLSLVSGIEKTSPEEWEGHLLRYLDMEGDFELEEIESDEEFNEVAAVIQEFEDKIGSI